MPNPLNIDDVKFIELRLKCLEPFITIASKTQIEQDVVIKRAEIAWNDFVVKPLMAYSQETTQSLEPQTIKPDAKPAKSKK